MTATSKHPLRPLRRPKLLQRVRALVAALPETSEKLAWGGPTFRVGRAQNMFAMFLDDHHGDGRIAIWCKAPAGVQELLVEAEPERFFRPPYVGPNGWIGIRIDGTAVDWEEIAETPTRADVARRSSFALCRFLSSGPFIALVP